MKKDLPPWSEAAKNFQPGIYRHFKGNEYTAIHVAHHSETFEELVVYHQGDATKGVWVRPLAMWNKEVGRDGYEGPRFTFIREA